MNALTCPEVETHLDLYAVGECDAPIRAAIESHLVNCPGCAEAFAKAKQVRGLLDLRLQEPERLGRLRARIEAEARKRRQPVILIFARRVRSLAALLLVAIGLLGWVGPRFPGEQEEAPQLTVALRSLPERDVAEKAVGRMVPAIEVLKAQVRPDEAKAEPRTYLLNLEGRTPEAFRRELREARKAGRLPPPPTLDLSLEVTNRSERAIRVWTGGDRTLLRLDLRGPGVVVVPVSNPIPQPFLERDAVTLQPGESFLLPIKQMVYGTLGDTYYAYWTEPGDYVLTAQYRTAMESAPFRGGKIESEENARKRFNYMTVTSPPIKVHVEAKP
jgi:hypothetical protein